MIPREALTNLGREVPKSDIDSYFDISKEQDVLRKKFIEAGFAHV